MCACPINDNEREKQQTRGSYCPKGTRARRRTHIYARLSYGDLGEMGGGSHSPHNARVVLPYIHA